MGKIFKIFITLIFFSILSSSIKAENVSYFIDFSKVLNQSKAGKDAQDLFKKKYNTDAEKFRKKEKSLREEESKIISQKKLLKKEEYQKKVEALRKKVADLQKEKQQSLNNIAKMKNKARQELLKALNPIIKEYMEQNKIRLVFDKKAILLGDSSLEITSQIIEILNKKLKKLNLN